MFRKPDLANKSHDRYRRITLASITGIAARVISAGTGLVSAPLTINYLGKEQFGLWMAVSSLVAWLQLTDLGMSNGLTNAISESHGRDDHKLIRQHITTALVSNIAISLLCAIPIVLLSKFLPWDTIFKIQTPGLASLASDCFLTVGLIFVLSMPIAIVGRVFSALQLGHWSNIIQIGTSVFGLACLLSAIKAKASMIWLIMIVSIGPILGHLVAWFVLSAKVPWCKISLNLVDLYAFKRIARSSIPLFTFQIGGLAVNQTTNIILANIGSLTLVADFNIVYKIYLFLFSIGSSISSPFYPAIREAFERGDQAWARSAIKKVVQLRTLSLLLPLIIIVFWGDKIVAAWIRQDLGMPMGMLGWFVFLLAMICSAISSTFGEVLSSLDHIWPQIKVVIISAFITIFGNLILVPKLNVMGIYLAFLISTFYPIYWGSKKIAKLLPTES